MRINSELLTLKSSPDPIYSLQQSTYSYYVYASEWAGSVCKHNDCLDSYLKQIDNKFWNIHGLWPTTPGGDSPSQQCLSISFQIDFLHPLTFDTLETKWSGLYADSSFFHAHEWDKHGRCWDHNSLLKNPSVIENQLIENPVLKNPVLENTAVLENSVLENQAIGNTVLENPVLENPVLENPVLENPVLGNPVLGNPVKGNPVTGNPVIGDPVIGNPVTGNPVIGNPVDDFFCTVVSLADSIDLYSTLEKNNIVPSLNKVYAVADFRAALKNKFNITSFKMLCNFSKDKQQYIESIYLCLDLDYKLIDCPQNVEKSIIFNDYVGECHDDIIYPIFSQIM